MKINLKHNQTGVSKQVKLGFSWTILFFGGFVPLFRGDLKWFAIMWLFSILTAGLAWLVFPFIYNRKYIEGLMEKGYVPADYYTKSQLQAKGITFQSG